MTMYPFALPEALRERLPSASRDGNRYVDVRVAGKWDGILVIDGAGMCVGIFLGRRIQEYPLPFAAGEIEDVRPASWKNRVAASIPIDLWDLAVLTIVVISPVVLLLGRLFWSYLAVFSVAACVFSIRSMYQAPGFPFLRLAVATWGVCQIVWGLGMIVPRLLSFLHQMI